MSNAIRKDSLMDLALQRSQLDRNTGTGQSQPFMLEVDGVGIVKARIVKSWGLQVVEGIAASIDLECQGQPGTFGIRVRSERIQDRRTHQVEFVQTVKIIGLESSPIKCRLAG